MKGNRIIVLGFLIATALGMARPGCAFEVPEAPPVEYFKNIWEQSPFDRKVLPDKPQEKPVNFVIQSMWTVGGVRYLTVMNKLDRSSFLVSSDPAESDDGMKLVDFSQGESLLDMAAKIEVNGQTVDARFDDSLMAGGAAIQAQPQPPQQGGTRRVVLPRGNTNVNQQKPPVQRSRSRGIVLPGR